MGEKNPRKMAYICAILRGKYIKITIESGMCFLVLVILEDGTRLVCNQKGF